jgi:hypothetical protein
MKLDQIFEYMIPIILMVLYFVVLAKSQKIPKEERKKIPPPFPHRKDTVICEEHQSKFEKKKDSINHHSELIVEKKTTHEDLDQLTVDPYYAHKTKDRPSRVEKLLKSRRSLRNAILLKEIIHRPYDF